MRGSIKELTVLPISNLLASFEYNAETGALFRLMKSGKRRQININGTYSNVTVKVAPGTYTTVSAHRLVWALYYGHWPKNEIDHLNGDLTDIRIVNLSDVTPAENMRNRLKRNAAFF